MEGHGQVSYASALFVQEVESCIDREEKICSFIQDRDNFLVSVCPFPKDVEFLNCKKPLSFDENLKGKIVILDFFTYCCINCMHVLPDLHKVEEKFSVEQGVVVVGVHSAKFKNEKVSANILNAILRYGINHAVVNDSDAILWNQMSIQCWPTFVVVNPDGNCLLHLVGEGHGKLLLEFVSKAVQIYEKQGKLKYHPLPIELKHKSLVNTLLSFPGKICPVNDDFAVADSGNNRVIIISGQGVIKTIFGDTEKGLEDGSPTKARFNSPQGLAYSNGQLYVADTNNHCIRKIDLETNKVTTIAGNGKQGTDKEGGKTGKEQEISSPWDVAVGSAPGALKNHDENVLYIAAAGTHQIWCFFLKDGSWIDKSEKAISTCLRFAGSGNEENRNNSYPHKASFAQPSGLTVADVNGCECIYVADSESSSIRMVALRNGAVKACVGGDRDPKNLFAFGDEDGTGINAKLQHPLGVAWNSKDGYIYVADSYNHKIKMIDPLSCKCTTLAGTGTPGLKDGPCKEAQFNEPGGLNVCRDGKALVVADSNNNVIRVINLETKFVEKMNILSADDIDAMVISSSPFGSEKVERGVKDKASASSPILSTSTVNFDEGILLEILVELPKSCYFTEGAPSGFTATMHYEGTEIQFLKRSGVLGNDGRASVQTEVKERNPVIVSTDVVAYYCSPEGVCLMRNAVSKTKVVHNESSADGLVQVVHSIS